MARFAPGDPLPRAGFTDPRGRPVDLADATHAGHPLVLALARPEAAADAARGLAAMGDALAAVGALAFVVSTAVPPRWATGAPLLVAAPGILDEVAEGLVLLDRTGTCLALLAPDALDRALALLAADEARRPRTLVAAQAPVLLLERVLDEPLCRGLLDYWSAQPKRDNEVASAKGASGAYGEARKRRSDVTVTDPALVGAVMAAFGQRVIPPVHKAFRVAIQSAEAFRIGCYSAEQQGAFARHRDNTTPYTAHRSFAVSLNLNDGYAGGALTFPEFGPMCYAPPPGGAVVFSCALLHEALPVTAGRRFGLFTFLNDRAGAARERNLRASLEKRA